eukprot:COSAG04_NODE_2449_length_4101_cov_30.628333_2_plen_623_part_00
MPTLAEWLGPGLYKAVGPYVEELGAEEVADMRNLQPEHIEAIKSKLKPLQIPKFQEKFDLLIGAQPEPEQAGKIQLWIKSGDGTTLSVTADHGLATTVAQMRAKVAGTKGVDPESCRLIFAGRELDDSLSLADYNCENASELNLILRVSEPEPAEADSSADVEAERQTAAVRAQMAGKKLADFVVSEKIGGKDIGAVGGAGYSQSGVCSYVYLAQLRGGNAMQFAVKVMLSYTEGMASSVAITQEFDAETALLSDPVRLPAHRHVMVVLHSFVDNATGLPEWDFEADIVNPRTMFVVMPYFPKDLKRVLKSARRDGQTFGDQRAVRIVHQLLQAVRHLKNHGVVHRDIKPDNVLLASVGTEDEAAVLTDFGMCVDLTKNHISDFRVPMPMDGYRRGGAPIALAPEITLPKPGPDVFLDYSKNDEWAVGIIAHEMLSKEAGPFTDMEHPATYTDAGYQDGSILEKCRPLVAALLKVAVADRIDAVEGSRRAKKLQGEMDQQQAQEEEAERRAKEKEEMWQEGTFERVKKGSAVRYKQPGQVGRQQGTVVEADDEGDLKVEWKDGGISGWIYVSDVEVKIDTLAALAISTGKVRCLFLRHSATRTFSEATRLLSEREAPSGVLI